MEHDYKAKFEVERLKMNRNIARQNQANKVVYLITKRINAKFFATS